MTLDQSVQTKIDQWIAKAKYGLSLIARHTHDGINSLKVNYANLLNAPSITTSIVLVGTSAATSGNYGVFYTFSSKQTIKSITEVHGTAGTDVGNVTLQIEKLTGTQASGAGTSLLTSAFNLKAAHNTVQTGVLVSGTTTQVNSGDRLGLVLTGTPTSIADLVVVVHYA